MMEYIKPPKIDASTPQEQIKQLEQYLFQLSNQLNFAFSTLDKKGENENGNI